MPLILFFVTYDEGRVCGSPWFKQLLLHLEEDGSGPELAALRRDGETQGVAVLGRTTLLSYASNLTEKKY